MNFARLNLSLCRNADFQSAALQNCILRGGNGGQRRRSAKTPLRPGRRRGAFTLIELIIVLALLAIVTSFVAPSLSRFFRGRALDSEARQLLSLTRACQSRAVSEGFPVLLWIDSQEREYGIQLENTTQNGKAEDLDPKAEQFPFDDTVRIEAPNASPVMLNGRNVTSIRFLADGSVDEESPRSVRLTSQQGDILWLMEATNRLSYEIRNSDK